jgi:hypothetical protein
LFALDAIQCEALLVATSMRGSLSANAFPFLYSNNHSVKSNSSNNFRFSFPFSGAEQNPPIQAQQAQPVIVSIS